MKRSEDKPRAIYLDWVEVYALEPLQKEPRDANYFRSRGFVVHSRVYGTRVFSEVFMIEDQHGQPFIEVRRAAYQSDEDRRGFMPVNGVHLRLTNNVLYAHDPIDKLREFMIAHEYEFVKLHRLDIALDFERFDFGDDPADFIRRYMHGRYAKVNQANIAAHGVDTWAGREWNSLSWGNPKSMVSTKMYCKSLELEQVHDKPYIKLAWLDDELIDSPVTMTKRGADGQIYKPVIWRVEFSIKSSAKSWYMLECDNRKHTRQPMPHVLSTYDTRDKLLLAFASLQRHYFFFRKYQPDQRKDRCEVKRLFDFKLDDKLMKLQQHGAVAQRTTQLDRLLIYLRMFVAVYNDADAYKAAQVIIDYLEDRKLRTMVTTDYDIAQLNALRRLIRERLEGYTEKPIAKHYRELVDLFMSDDAPF